MIIFLPLLRKREKWLGRLLWKSSILREVNMQIQWHFYATLKNHCFLKPENFTLKSLTIITGPPTHSVGGRLVTVAGVCRRRL